MNISKPVYLIVLNGDARDYVIQSTQPLIVRYQRHTDKTEILLMVNNNNSYEDIKKQYSQMSLLMVRYLENGIHLN